MSCYRAIPATAEEMEREIQNKKSRLDVGGDVDLGFILGMNSVDKVGTTNPVKDFSLLLQSGKKSVEEIYDEMSKVILELLEDSGGTNVPLMVKAKNCIEAYREHSVAEGRVAYFNRWMKQFKEQVISNYFTDFWQKYFTESLGLITKDECPLSDVDKHQAETFLRLPKQQQVNEIDSVDEDEELVSVIFLLLFAFLVLLPCDCPELEKSSRKLAAHVLHQLAYRA